MARYSIRDIFGHFVKPKARSGDLCPHRCCRNRRVHPENLPVMLRPDMLRRLPEETLVNHYVRVVDNPEASAQALKAINRREREDKQRAERKARVLEGRQLRAFQRRTERQELIEYELRRAEEATSGNLVNAKGVRAGVTDVSLFTGSEARAMRYASGDLLRYWEDHPRPSAGLTSANPAVVRRARARSDIGRQQPKQRRRADPYGVY